MAASKSACRACGEFVYWLREHESNQLNPVDVKMSDRGTVYANLESGKYAVVLPEDRPIMRSDVGLRQFHVETCTQRRVMIAKQHQMMRHANDRPSRRELNRRNKQHGQRIPIQGSHDP